MERKNFLFVALVLFTASHNHAILADSSTDVDDWNKLVRALKNISKILTKPPNSNPSNFTYEGIGTLAKSLQTLRINLDLESGATSQLLTRLKTDFSKLKSLNKTLIVPPQKKSLKGCSYPFEQTKLGCFWFHELPTLEFNNARIRCQDLGADLLVIPKERFKAFKSLLRKKYGSGYIYVWVGARQHTSYYTSSTAWKWIDGTTVDFTKDDWFIPNPPLRGPCMALNGGKGHSPMPWDCDDKSSFVCEKKLEGMEE